MIGRTEKVLITLQILACLLPFFMFIGFFPRLNPKWLLIPLGIYAWFTLAWLCTHVWNRPLSRIPWPIWVGCGVGYLLAIYIPWRFSFFYLGNGSTPPSEITLLELSRIVLIVYFVFLSPAVLASHLLFVAWRNQRRANSAAHPDAREASHLLSPSQSRAGGRER
jgi:hypothetical protein